MVIFDGGEIFLTIQRQSPSLFSGPQGIVGYIIMHGHIHMDSLEKFLTGTTDKQLGEYRQLQLKQLPSLDHFIDVLHTRTFKRKMIYKQNFRKG